MPIPRLAVGLLVLPLALLLGGCSGDESSPHRVYVTLGFHGNFYHSWRGDTPDEAGFGQDIRIVREILRILDEANARGLDARGYWDVENLFTYERILPEHAPDIIESLQRRIGEGLDEALLMPYDNGLLHAMTEDELRANLRWAIRNPWGSGVQDLFGRYAPLLRPQEMTLTAGPIPILEDEGVEGLVLLWTGVPFNALSTFVPPLPPEQRYGTTRVRLREEGPSTILLPAASVGDVVDHVSLEKWMLDLRALQTRGIVDGDLLLHINADADADSWLPQEVPTGFGWLPNVGGLVEYIEAVNKYDWAAFTTPGEWLATHPPEGEVLVRQDLADGGFDGQYSWAEKLPSHEIWTGLDQSRLATWRADVLAVGAAASARARAEALLREGRDSSFFQRVEGLSTTHFGMSTPIVNEERQAVAEKIVGRARERARKAERLLADEVAQDAGDLPADVLYAFEVRDVRLARDADDAGPARTLLRLPVIFPAAPPTLRLTATGRGTLPHALVDLEALDDGRTAGELWTLLSLGPGERVRLHLRPAPQGTAPPSPPPSGDRLENERLAVTLDPEAGIASLRSEGRELAGDPFLSAFLTYREDDQDRTHPSQQWRIEADPVPGSDGWLRRVRLATRIPFATPEDGEVAARVEAVLSLPADAPWIVADVRVDYPYTTKRDILHNPAQKLRRYLDLRWVEVAPFQIHPRLDGSRDDPLRVWKHNYLGLTTYYDLDYARINPANAELDAFNHQVTAGWVAVSDREQGLLVAEDADVRASFAFAPMRLREREGRQRLWLNPFGSYYGEQLDYSHTDGTGLGAEVTEIYSSSLHPNGPSYNGERERFSLLLAPYAGDAPPADLRADASTFFAAPAVVYLRAPEGVDAAEELRLPHELRTRIAEARRAQRRAAAEPPPRPRAFLVNPTTGAADVVWDAPRDAVVDGYEVAWRPVETDGAAEGPWRTAQIPPARRHRVADLENARTYAFRLRARGPAGPGPWTETHRAEIGPVGVVEMGGVVDEMPLGLKLRLFRAGLVHWWATR